MQFVYPLALLLFVVLAPLILYLGWPRTPRRRRRDVASLILRLAIVALLILGLAGAQSVQAADKLSVVFLLDESDSIDAQMRAQAEAFIREALRNIKTNDRAAVVAFGKNALIERPLSPSGELSPLGATPIRLETDMAEAIRLGVAMFPADAARRIVILSDGIQTEGDAAEAARLAAANSVQIDYVPLTRVPGPEVLVTNVSAPSTVGEDELFDVTVTVQSEAQALVTMTITAGGSVILAENVTLQAGTNAFTRTLKAPKQGFADLAVRVDPAAGSDTFYQNNELAAFTQVTGEPRILLVTQTPEEIASLLPALQNSGIGVDVVNAESLPSGLAGLASYKSIVLANVPATVLTDSQMRLIQTYVRDLGGGLVMIGGPESYGVGGYFETPIEETLPVQMQLKDQKRVPSLTMVYVIDRSGSMEVIGVSGITNLELAKEASRRSINFLYPRDRAGVLSFDSDPQWLVQIQPVTNKDSMVSQIGALRPGGGTDIYNAVKKIQADLPGDPSTLKHVILLTDGGADPTGIVEMVESMKNDHNITTTAIGIGDGVPPFMQDIARAGGGTYYKLADARNIPQIFSAETVLITRSYIVEKDFTPILTANNEMLRGITAVPELKGYVATSAKDTATIVLTAPGYNDPLLATWQYGLGRAVAWTSDAAPRWSVNWVQWDGFQRFWSQIIRSSIVEGLDTRLETRVVNRDGKSILVVEARDEEGGYLNGLALKGSVVDPKLAAKEVQLQQVAPGIYEGEIQPGQEGAYFIGVSGTVAAGEENVAVTQRAGWVLTYSPEYRLRDADPGLLQDIGDLTSGRNLTNQIEAVFAHDIASAQSYTPLFPLLLLLAALLLPLDIAVRRVVVTRTDLIKLREWVATKLNMQRRQVNTEATIARLSALREAKTRAGQSTSTPVTTGVETVTANPIPTEPVSAPVTPPVNPVVNSPVIPTPTPIAPRQVQSTPEAAPVPKPAPKPTAVPQAEPSEPGGSGSLASRLVNKRRRTDD